MGEFDVDVNACRGRQQRLIASMQRHDVELTILTQRENILWLTGFLAGPMFQPAAALTADGRMTLVAPGRKLPQGIAADEVVGYEAQWHSTLRNDQRAASSAMLLQSLVARPTRIGVEFSSLGPVLSQPLAAELVDLEPEIYRLRRHKDADELRFMQKAIDATAAMYARAREIIRPGVNELKVYSELYATTVRTFQEPPTYFGQDFQCNARGGPPRNRHAEAGELYILDLGAGFRGYFSDNARTIAVDGQPTDAQQQAWQQIQKVFHLIETTVKPGVRAKIIFEQAQAILDEVRPWTFDHHLGHGIGLYPHEAPHLNPFWDDTFAAGEVFTVEPGLYHETLRQGMRLEQNYLVTADGVRLLTPFTLAL